MIQSCKTTYYLKGSFQDICSSYLRAMYLTVPCRRSYIINRGEMHDDSSWRRHDIMYYAIIQSRWQLIIIGSRYEIHIKALA